MSRAARQVALAAALIEVARDLFAQHGFTRCTMREIAKMADVSTGAIFHNWASKDALFIAATGFMPDPAFYLAAVIDGTEFAPEELRRFLGYWKGSRP